MVRRADGIQFSQPQSTHGRRMIQSFLLNFNQRRTDARVQWHWLREGTPNRNLNEVIEMLRNNAFLVGLTSKFDESLILWRLFMGLFVEDIIYHKMKADFDHPRVADWHQSEISMAKRVIARNGDSKFYDVASEVFEAQVAVYGGWEKLQRETAAFQRINTQLQSECEHVFVQYAGFGLFDRAVCMVARYRAHGFGAEYGEA